MKQFDVPVFYRSPIISKIKAKRRIEDPRKKDFSPSIIQIADLTFIFARHFGFCYGVENAIEISYKALKENLGKRIFLLSEMIHNPAVNDDLIANGIQFLQDTSGNQLIPFSTLTADDVVIVPAFGTTVEIQAELESIGINVQAYNTTCPFVEKVWNRSKSLGLDKHTIIVHGKATHEETRATVSHSSQNAPVIVVYDMSEALFLGDVILGKKSFEDFYTHFEGKYSANFDVTKDLEKIGVVNQTTMLASDTQAIADFLRAVMLSKYGESNIKMHIADTRDTLCYATNDNQSATNGLLAIDADVAIVVGGYKSSNTTHLVELLETKFKTFFIESANCIQPNLENSNQKIENFDIHLKTIKNDEFDFSKTKKIIITSGASCPDSMVEAVIEKILSIHKIEFELENLV